MFSWSYSVFLLHCIAIIDVVRTFMPSFLIDFSFSLACLIFFALVMEFVIVCFIYKANKLQQLLHLEINVSYTLDDLYILHL